jgi:hypothetical protein
MGQYWKLVNIDKGCSLRHRGGVKYRSMLLSRVSEQLLDLLGVHTAGWTGGFRIGSAAVAQAKSKWYAVISPVPLNPRRC